MELHWKETFLVKLAQDILYLHLSSLLQFIIIYVVQGLCWRDLKKDKKHEKGKKIEEPHLMGGKWAEASRTS